MGQELAVRQRVEEPAPAEPQVERPQAGDGPPSRVQSASEPSVDSQPGAREGAPEPPPPLESRTQASVWPRPDGEGEEGEEGEEGQPGSEALQAFEAQLLGAEPSGVGRSAMITASPTLAARQRGNPVEIHRALESSPRDRSLLHGLFDALGRAADIDRRWCIAQVLVFLDDADYRSGAVSGPAIPTLRRGCLSEVGPPGPRGPDGPSRTRSGARSSRRNG